MRKSLYCANQVLETVRAISVVTTEICFGKPLSGNNISSSVRNLRDLVMYLVLLLFKMLEQVRILLLGLPLSTLMPRGGNELLVCSYEPLIMASALRLL